MKRYCLHNELKIYSILIRPWGKNIINVIINLLLSKRKEYIYNSIYITVDRFIKIIKYLSTNKKTIII